MTLKTEGGKWGGRLLELAGCRRRLTLILAMFAVAFVVRCYRLWEPPMDFHPTRQYIGAAVARSYYFNMDSSIPEWRRSIAQIAKDRQELLEPQIMPSLAAVSYLAAGGERLWMPRLFSVVVWLGCGWLLLLIGRDIGLSPPARLWALAVHLFVPFAVLNSRVFQPDPLMVLLMFATLWAALGYDRNPGARKLLGVSALAAATLFVKPVCVFIIFAGFAALMIKRLGLLTTAKQPHLYFFTVLMLTPALAFYMMQLSSGGYIGTHTEGSFIPSLPGTGKYWAGWLKMIGRNIGLQGLAAAIAGIALLSNLRGRWFLGGIWFGYFCYGLFFNYHIHTHDYYSMMLIPMAGLSAASFLVWLTEFILAQWRERRLRLVGFLAVAAAIGGAGVLGIAKFDSAGKLSSTAKGKIKAAGSYFGADMKLLKFLGHGIDERAVARRYEEIGEALEHTDRALYLTHDHGKSLTYHAEIAGGNWPGQTDFAKLRMAGKPPLDLRRRLALSIADEGMRFFVATELDEFRKQPELIDVLSKSHDLLISNEFHQVYRLRNAGQ